MERIRLELSRLDAEIQKEVSADSQFLKTTKPLLTFTQIFFFSSLLLHFISAILRDKIHVADNELVAAENAFKTIEKQHLSFTIALVSRVTISSFFFPLFCNICSALHALYSSLSCTIPVRLTYLDTYALRSSTRKRSGRKSFS